MTVIHSWDEVPVFASEADESAFWAEHELGEMLLGQMAPDADQTLPPPRPRTKPIALRFDEDTIRRAKALAARRGKGYQTLLKEFVSERLYEEEKRDGLIGTGLAGSVRAERQLVQAATGAESPPRAARQASKKEGRPPATEER
jgi:hypothetical protein